ncbi:MAG TPA: tetraacyldisaccharide 4'-kinase [Pyrinomonadaceae bacterium]|jgi:tetraacyldisaccharide 4'-kinase
MLPPSSFILAPLSAVYGGVMRARASLYAAGLFRTQRVEAPVVSVGNITLGGTGKTPLVEWLARALSSEGRRVCILTRGYGREKASRRVVVSDGERVLAEAREGGDEPRLLAEMLKDAGVAVLSDADRVAAARWAMENLQSELFILDDGFQHMRLARDLDIVTLDATDPFGGGRLLPRGRLREPIEGLRRAGAIIITRAEMAADLDALRAEVARLANTATPIFTSRLRTERVRLLSSATKKEEAEGDAALNLENDAISKSVEAVPQPVAAFCGVGNPEAFFAHARRDGQTLSYTCAFRDHHGYTQADVDALVAEARRHGARALLTTAKDAVKLRTLGFALPCYVVEVTVEFDDEERLLAVVRGAVGRREAEASRKS